jgi:sensor histidine kinase YesM
MTRRTVYWLCQIGGWSLYCIINLFFLLLGKDISANYYLFVLLSTAYLLVFSHLFRLYIHKRDWLHLSTGKLLPRLLMGILVISVLTNLFQANTNIVLRGSFSAFNLTQSVLDILTNLVLFSLWTFIYIGYHYVERYNATLKYEAAINEMTLNRLKSQLNPHFMFNALNSIRALVDEEPAKAKEAITQMSNILRNSLVMDKRKLVPFKDELQTVKDYLALETIRFEERLQSHITVDPEAEDFPIPPMMLQTLVENGIKHGISNLIEGGILQLVAYEKDNLLHVDIRNSGQYVNGKASSKAKSTGLGLANTRQRLRLLYGERATFKIKNFDQNTVLTQLILPKLN